MVLFFFGPDSEKPASDALDKVAGEEEANNTGWQTYWGKRREE